MNPEIRVDRNGMELIHHGTYGFPFRLLQIVLSEYPLRSFPYHWHPEIEVTYIQEGKVLYQVGNARIILNAGDWIFVNANVPHGGEQIHDADCRWMVAILDPRIIGGFGGSDIQRTQVEPLLRSAAFPYHVIRQGDPDQPELAQLMRELLDAETEAVEVRQLHTIGILCRMWIPLYRAFCTCSAAEQIFTDQSQWLKEALRYLYAHYVDQITLDDLVKNCHTSKSELCRRFKTATGQSPMTYLLHYRIRQSLPLLEQTELSVTDIAGKVGFSGSSYYAEIFRRYMGCSPRDYRRKQQTNG